MSRYDEWNKIDDDEDEELQDGAVRYNSRLLHDNLTPFLVV